MRQVLGAVAEFEKTTLVAKLAAARRRKRDATGRRWRAARATRRSGRGRRAGQGAGAQEAEGRADEPAGDLGRTGGAGLLNERGAPFNPKSIAAMLAGRS